MNSTILNKGDLVLLFDNLPYDYESDLPLSPITGVTVASTPQSLLDTPDSDHLPCYVLPGTKLPGMGINNCCLISRASESIPVYVTRDSLLFSYLTALRLLAPAHISVAGQFQYGGVDEPISHPALRNTHSAWQPDPNYCYSADDFKRAGKILDRMMMCMSAGPIRLKYSMVMFSQVTNGFSHSYQMGVLALYAALEALFAPKGKNYAKRLGGRVGAYLSSYDHGLGISGWIEKHYLAERHSLSHGFWQFSPDSVRVATRSNEFGIIHEITRLVLLGFLSMDTYDVLFLDQNGPQLQKVLDNTKPANGQYLQGQKMWLA